MSQGHRERSIVEANREREERIDRRKKAFQNPTPQETS